MPGPARHHRRSCGPARRLKGNSKRCHGVCFFLISRPPPRPTLFPYTTLFRSSAACQHLEGQHSEAVDICSRGHRRSEEHTSELQSRVDLVCRLLLEKKKRQSGARCDRLSQCFAATLSVRRLAATAPTRWTCGR